MSERDLWQKHLAALYESEIETALGLAQNVLPYLITDPKGASPLVCVTSAGTSTIDATHQGYGRDTLSYYMDVFVFVLHSRKAESYTNVNAETKLADVTESVMAVNKAHNDEPEYWSSIEYREPTRIIAQDIAGSVYLIESHRLNVFR